MRYVDLGRTTTSASATSAAGSPTTSASSAPSASKSRSPTSPNPTQTKQARPRPPDPYRRPAGLGGPDDQDPLPHARLISIFRVRRWGQTPGCAKCMRNWTALKAFALVRGVRWGSVQARPFQTMSLARDHVSYRTTLTSCIGGWMSTSSPATQAGICASSLGCGRGGCLAGRVEGYLRRHRSQGTSGRTG